MDAIAEEGFDVVGYIMVEPGEDCAGLVCERREGSRQLCGYPVERRNGFAGEFGSVGIWGREIAAEETGGCGSRCLGVRLWFCGMEFRDIGARCERNRWWRSGGRRCWARCSFVGSICWCLDLRLVHTIGKSRPGWHRRWSLWQDLRGSRSRRWPCRSSWRERWCSWRRLYLHSCNAGCRLSAYQWHPRPLHILVRWECL